MKVSLRHLESSVMLDATLLPPESILHEQAFKMVRDIIRIREEAGSPDGNYELAVSFEVPDQLDQEKK